MSGESPKGYLSSWAFGRVHRGGRTDAHSLALALGMVQSAVEVISGGERYRCEFASADTRDMPTSYTSFGERRIVVSAQAILDASIEHGDGIDVTVGYGLHEGSHVRHTSDLWRSIMKPRIEPMAVATMLGNIVEDTRIETLTSDEYPGFAGYFERTNAYLWDIQQSHAPRRWDEGKATKPSAALANKMNAILFAVKWPADYAPIAQADKRLSVEFDWWNGWRDDYLAGRTDFRATVEAGMARLREDEATAKELDRLTAQEREYEKQLASLAAAIAKQLQEMADSGALSSCPSGGTMVELPRELAARVNKLVSEKLEIHRPFVPQDGTGTPPEVVVLHPQESRDSRARYVAPAGSLVARMRSAFRFRPVARLWSSRIQRSGTIDAQQLWRLAADDQRVFERKTIEGKPDTSVTLLVDQSGSMSGRNISQAIEAAGVMHACLRDTPGVAVRVRSHTADSDDSGEGNIVVYRIWEHGEPLSRLGLIGTLDPANNGDGYAIEWCARELLADTRPNEQRLLIVLSDGRPSATCYRRGSGEDHVRAVTDWAARHDVTVVQVAIDSVLRPAEQGRMFGRNWLPYEGMPNLPLQLTRLLARTL